MYDRPKEDRLRALVARLPVGALIRRQPGGTCWARSFWRPAGVLPGAAPAEPPAQYRETANGEAVGCRSPMVGLELHHADMGGCRGALASGLREQGGEAPVREGGGVHAVPTARPRTVH